MLKVLLCGGSGLIGSKLRIKLKQINADVVLFSTQKKLENGQNVFYWNPDEGVFPDLNPAEFDAVINLCGAGIFDSYFTENRKKVLRDSRILPLRLLHDNLRKEKLRLPHLISVSGVGIYPDKCLNVITEDSTMGMGFIPGLVRDWEKEALSGDDCFERITILRLGTVMTPKGGFLGKLSLPLQYGLGAVPGSGRQMVSWIHIDDLCNIFIHVLENKIQGIYNCVAPYPENLNRITRLLAARLRRPLWLPHIPVFILRLVFGRERAALILSDQQISPKKLTDTGFRFQFNTADSALNNLFP